jgi:hypothetical protein
MASGPLTTALIQLLKAFADSNHAAITELPKGGNSGEIVTHKGAGVTAIKINLPKAMKGWKRGWVICIDNGP